MMDNNKLRDDYTNGLEEVAYFICGNCEAEVYPHHTYCWSCGRKLFQEDKKC